MSRCPGGPQTHGVGQGMPGLWPNSEPTVPCWRVRIPVTLKRPSRQ